MADFRLSSQADSDLGGIAIHTIENFGIEQARREIANLAVRASIARDLSGVGKRFREQGSLLPPAKRGHDGKPLMPRLTCDEIISAFEPRMRRHPQLLTLF